MTETITREQMENFWTKYFPYERVYNDQVDGIETFLNTLASRNHMLMEGACGTGKTLIGLTAGLSAIREPAEWATHQQQKSGWNKTGSLPTYERVFIATPVKQQLKQFVEEMRVINNQQPADGAISTVVLRGRDDMVPYLSDSVGKNQYDRDDVDTLRQRSRELVSPHSDYDINWGLVSASATRWSPPENASVVEQYDPNRIRAILERLEEHVDSQGTSQMNIDGQRVPYPEYLPKLSDVANVPEIANGRFDPFYIGFLAHAHPEIHEYEQLTFADLPDSIVDTHSLWKKAITRGICPHSQMAHLLEEADVVIGNYYHVLDPMSRQLTKKKVDVLDGETVLILDEAHNLETIARDVFSFECSRETLEETQQSVGAIESMVEQRYEDFTTLIPGENPFEQITSMEDLETFQNQVVANLTDQIDLQQLPFNSEAEIFELFKADDIPDDKTWDDLTADTGKGRREAANRAFGGSSQLVKMILQDLTDNENTVRELLRPVSGTLRRAQSKLREQAETLVSNDYPDREYPTIEEVSEHGLQRYEKSIDRPKSTNKDEITKEIADAVRDDLPSGYQTIWSLLEEIEGIITLVNQILPKDSQLTASASSFLLTWGKADRTQYFREVIVEPTVSEDTTGEASTWQDLWTARYRIHNTLPTEQLRHRFSEVGSVLLMSATLEPLEAYQETTGVGDSLYPSSFDTDNDLGKLMTVPKSTTTDTREIITRQYPLRFSETNRGTYAVKLPKFTYKNRGDPVTQLKQMSRCRQQYLHALEDAVCRIPNVLICMPSYREAQWVVEILEERVDKPIYLDQSSSATETSELLDQFMPANEAILVTSSLGTVIEGVDYKGDALHGTIVVGIPIKPQTDRRQATIDAYDARLDTLDGWTAVNQIPAIRKARQAIGRVIRGPEELGVRLFFDERYAYTEHQRRDGVQNYLSEQEQQEVMDISPEYIQPAVDRVLKQ